ncbi:hypothetical protein WOLCODRAFT_155032 [Wolfiporia cocos MD-104 SS10]|uniref:Uncharacterized protein n=1 Tax=Wolfiporia cocos (strain MD-104) TaxID=742152 RepID=A0A2H3JTX4_WOLCO|nr:hypothetical protein WOLCODRAFT_155032 [Wolfiporia cocos MD-104 SS10]
MAAQPWQNPAKGGLLPLGFRRTQADLSPLRRPESQPATRDLRDLRDPRDLRDLRDPAHRGFATVAMAKNRATTTIRNGRHLPRLDLGHWDTATPLHFTTVTLLTTSSLQSKDGGTDDAAWLVLRAPPLPRLTKPGSNAHHVTSSDEPLVGAAPDSTDSGETDSPPPGTPIQN